MINFDQTDVSVNGTGILAQSAGLNINAEIAPFYSVGRRGVLSQGPVGPKNNSARISYVLEVDNEPNYAVVNNIKNFSSTTEDLLPAVINIGGVSGAFYLASYSIQAEPNSPVKASVSYVGFNQTTGQISEKTNNLSYNLSSGSGIGYGFSAYITTSGNFTLDPTFAFDYEFNASFQPVYALGRMEPISVKLLGANERMTVSRTGLFDPTFSGIDPHGPLFDRNGSTGIQIFGLKFFCEQDASDSVDINVSGAKINTTQVSIGVDNIVLSQTTFRKFY